MTSRRKSPAAFEPPLNRLSSVYRWRRARGHLAPAQPTVKWLAIVLLVATFAAPAAANTLDLETYLDFERVADPQISPDGERIVYTRRWVDRVNDRWKSQIWIMDRDGSKNRFLLDGSSPRWSPSGDRLAFLREGEPTGSQLFVRWMDDEGAVTQITRVDRSPQSIEWSPGGEQLAFVMLVPQSTQWKIDLPKAPKGAKWTEAPRIVERMTYRRDRQGFLEEGFHHLFVVPAEGGTARQLTEGDYHHGRSGISWASDGSELFFAGLRDDDWEHLWRETELYAVSVADGVVRQLTQRRGPDQGPKVSPDGRHVAYTGYDFSRDTYITSRIYLMPTEGGEARILTEELDRNANGLQWSPDSERIYFNVSDSGRRNLHVVDLDGTVEKVTHGQHMLSVSSIGSGLAVGVRTAHHEPGDVVSIDLSRGASSTTQLTDVNGEVLAGIELGEVEEIVYESTDGLEIQGWIVKPPDFDPEQQYPMMLAIHGGPHGMYNVGFNYGWQEHAAQGYVILYTNPRGSSGYGSAFGNEIKWAYPSKDYDDLMNGVDRVLERGYVDEDRLFVYGCSGGGVLTAWVVGHTNRFAAASSNCPVTNWLSFVGTTDGPSHWYRNFEHNFWDDPSEHLRRSPIMYVGNVETPTMLMTGVDDLRTPMSQTEEYYQALKMRKVPTAMVRFNGEYHGTSSKPSNFLRTQLYLRHWFEKWAPPEETAPTAAESTGGR